MFRRQSLEKFRRSQVWHRHRHLPIYRDEFASLQQAAPPALAGTDGAPEPPHGHPLAEPTDGQEGQKRAGVSGVSDVRSLD